MGNPSNPQHQDQKGAYRSDGSATAADIQSSLGLAPEVADRIVSERVRLGGFADPEQLMTEVGMPPHVYAGIRDRVTASRSSSRRGTGRKLDL